MNRLRTLSTLAVLTCSFVLHSTGARAQNRIVQAPSGNDSAGRIALPDGVPPRARLAHDLGPVAPNMKLSGVTLRFSQTAAQTADLRQLLVDQQNPYSSSFHQWLTPEQFGSRFGLSEADLGTVTAWLQSQGLRVTSLSRSRTFVTVSGPAARVQAAFATPIHQVSVDGRLHFTNLNSPSLPASIAPVVLAVTGLDNFRLRPHSHAHTVPGAEFTSSVTGNHFIAPGDFYTIYDVNPLLTSSIDGSGVTIAVMGQTDISLPDVAAFRKASGLSAKAPTVKVYGTDPGNVGKDDTIEAHLDVEWAGAVAPNANILFVNSKDVLSGSLLNAIDNNLAPIITLSYGNCESGFGASNMTSFDASFQQANAQGQTILSAAGDSGATDCDYKVASATHGLAVDYPSSSAYVTGLGGTIFNEGSGTYWNTTQGAYSGSAISYIPEAVWNEPGGTNLTAGGGGASASFPKPAWQTGPGVPSDALRDVPDVSLNAAAGHDGYLYCASGFCTNGYRDAAGNLQVVGGTSVAAPAFAGILALLEQKLGTRLGNANPTIYGLANSTYSSAVFHDTTSGNNMSPCTAASTGCPSGGSLGYNATAGYDRASGWGSVDTFNLVNDWALVQPAGSRPATTSASSTSISPATSSASVGASVSYTVNVSSVSTTARAAPTGSVQLLVDDVASGSAVALANGSATLNVATSGLSAASHTVTAAYSGDTGYASSKASATLNLGTVSSAQDFSLNPSSSSASAKSGSAATGVTFTLGALGGFSGRVTLNASAASAIGASFSFSANPVSICSGCTNSMPPSSANTVLTLYASAAGANGGTTALNAAGKGTSAELHQRGTAPWLPLGSGIALAGLFCLGLPRKRRAGWSALAVTLLSVAMLTMSGCGSGGTVPNPSTQTPAGTKPGTYTVVVSATGTDSTGKVITHTANVNFVVQ